MSIFDWFKRPKQQQPDRTAQLEFLPRWAGVAFAARCARRIQAKFREHYSDVPSRFLDLVENTITLAEQSAARGATAENADEVVKRVLGSAGESEVIDLVASVAANAALAAAAAPGSQTTWVCDNLKLVDNFSEMIREPSLVRDVEADLKRLAERISSNHWDDRSLVSPGAFSPQDS